MDTIIEHSMICAATAKKMGISAEQVDSTVTNYADQFISFLGEKRPTNYKDRLYVQTPLVSARINLEKEKIVTENGKKYRVPEQYQISYGIYTEIFKAVNKGLDVAKSLIEDDKKDDVKVTNKKVA